MTGSSRPATTTVSQQQTNEPWSGAQPALNLAMGSAMSTFNQGPPQYYPGNTVAPFSQQTVSGMNAIQNNAQMTAPWAQTAAGGVNRIIGAGPTPGTEFASSVASGFGARNPFMGATAAAARAPNAGLQALSPWMTGQAGANPFISQIGAIAGQPASGIGTDTLTQAAGGGFINNPFLDQAVGRATDAVRQNVSTMFARGGRFGSSAHQDVLQKGVGDVASQMYGQAYQSDMANRMGAAGQLAGYEQGNIDRQLQAANAQAGLAEQGFGRQYDAATLMPAYFEQGLNRTLSGLGQAGNMFSTGVGQSLGAFGALGDDFAQRSGTTLNAIGAMPGVYDFANQGARDVMGVGSMLEGYDQAQIDADRARWDYTQNADRSNIEWLNAIATGQGQLGGTSYGTQQVPFQRQNPFLQGVGALGSVGSLFSSSAGGTSAIAGMSAFL